MNGSEMLIDVPYRSRPLPTAVRADGTAAVAASAARLERRARAQLVLPLDDDALARRQPFADDRRIGDVERDLDRTLLRFAVGAREVHERTLRPALHRRR